VRVGRMRHLRTLPDLSANGLNAPRARAATFSKWNMRISEMDSS